MPVAANFVAEPVSRCAIWLTPLLRSRQGMELDTVEKILCALRLDNQHDPTPCHRDFPQQALGVPVPAALALGIRYFLNTRSPRNHGHRWPSDFKYSSQLLHQYPLKASARFKNFARRIRVHITLV